jgi:hypothetical protein
MTTGQKPGHTNGSDQGYRMSAQFDGTRAGGGAVHSIMSGLCLESGFGLNQRAYLMVLWSTLACERTSDGVAP